jgi:hypothetical protein
VIFDDVSKLHVEPDSDCEAWDLSGLDGLLIVCMVGGQLVIWSGIAPAINGQPQSAMST